MSTHLAAQGSSRLRGRIGATQRWHGEAPEELHHALKVAVAAERLATVLTDDDFSADDLVFLRTRFNEIADINAHA